MKMKNLFYTMLAITALVVAIALPHVQAQEKKEPPTQVLIANVNVWDGTSDTTKKVDVLVEGNKIKRIGKIDAPKAVKIDGQGGTVTPGLIDMHQHLMLNGGTAAGNNWDAYVQGAHATRAAQYLLMQGFTTIRDIAGNSIGIKRAINQGISQGHSCIRAGPAKCLD